MLEIIFKSLISAVITAVILVLAKFANPKLAGAIGGIPIVFAISYVLVTMEDRLASTDFLIGGAYGAVAAIFFSVILIVFNGKFPEQHWINFAVAYALCFCMAYGLTYFTSNT